jgi:cell division septal protein FtsQ
MRRRVGANRRKKMAERRARTRSSSRGALRPLVRVVKVFVLAGLVGVGGYVGARKAASWVASSSLFVLENVRVLGVSLLDTTDVLARADLSLGTHLSRLDVRRVARQLKENPVIRRVRVRRRLPNGVDIVVQERIPVAMVNLGTIFLADCEGVLVELVPNRYVNAPVMSGLSDTTMEDGTRRLKGESVALMNRFLDGARAVRPDIAGRISQVTFDRGGGARFRLAASPTVVEIEMEHVERSFRQLWQLVESRERQGREQPRSISLRYSNLAFVR